MALKLKCLVIERSQQAGEPSSVLSIVFFLNFIIFFKFYIHKGHLSFMLSVLQSVLVSPFLSHPLCLPRCSLSQPQECISRNAWRDELDQTSSGQRRSPAVLSPLPSLCLLVLFLCAPPPVPLSPFPRFLPVLPPPPPAGLPLFLLAALQTLLLLFFSVFLLFFFFFSWSLLYFSGTMHTKRSFECLCV